MLSNVFILGLVGGQAAVNARYLEVTRNYKDHQGHFAIDVIPVMYWSKSPNNFFMTLKEGTYVAVHGRLENHEKLGLTVICEYLEFMGNHPLETVEPSGKM